MASCKKSLFFGKKAQSVNTDTYYFFLIIAIFLIAAWVIPYVNQAFDTSYVAQNINKPSSSGLVGYLLGGLDYIKTLFALAFWDFGNLGIPTWIQVIFKLLDLVLIYLGIRLVRGV